MCEWNRDDVTSLKFLLMLHKFDPGFLIWFIKSNSSYSKERQNNFGQNNLKNPSLKRCFNSISNRVIRTINQHFLLSKFKTKRFKTKLLRITAWFRQNDARSILFHTSKRLMKNITFWKMQLKRATASMASTYLRIFCPEIQNHVKWIGPKFPSPFKLFWLQLFCLSWQDKFTEQIRLIQPPLFSRFRSHSKRHRADFLVFVYSCFLRSIILPSIVLPF